MTDSIFLPSHMINIVNLADVIAAQEVNIINDLYAIDKLSKITFTDSDTKKAFYFHIINGVCEFLDDQSVPGDTVFYYSSCDLKFLELTNYVSVVNVKNFLDTLTSHINRVLPVAFHKNTKCFEHLKRDKTGEKTDTVLDIKNTCVRKRYNPASFRKIQKFIKEQQFNYLDKKFFSKYRYMMKLV